MRQALAVSSKGREPKSFLPWSEDRRTRSFEDFKRSYPQFFAKKRG